MKIYTDEDLKRRKLLKIYYHIVMNSYIVYNDLLVVSSASVF